MLVRRLDKNNEPCLGHGASDFVTGADAVATLVYLALKLNLGSWFLDTSLGTAWWQQDESQPQILGRMPADLDFAQSELKRVVLSTSGVASITSFAFNFDRVKRAAEITVVVMTVYGVPRTIVARSDQ
jgi:hypothetical protein